MIQQLVVQVDVPKGYELTGEHRAPLDGEKWCYISKAGCVNFGPDAGKRAILRKLWAFPSWFRAGWWLRRSSHDGKWYAMEYDFCSYYSCPADILWAFHGETFTPPTVDKLQCVR